MKNKFAIGIPTLNRADLLIPSLERYSKDFEGIDILVIDNGCQKDLFDWVSKSSNAHIQYVCNKVNIGVAGSWNCILHNLFNSHQYILVLNDDVYLGKHTNEIDEIIDKSQSQLIVGEMFFSVFIIDRNFHIFCYKLFFVLIYGRLRFLVSLIFIFKIICQFNKKIIYY
jgi:glycosyltransferase involved in cell wall biosynthesis